MENFPIKLNEWINAFVAHNWLAVAIFLAVLSGLAEKFPKIQAIYQVFRDAWKVVRPPSNGAKKS